jgi:hypothetical protein
MKSLLYGLSIAALLSAPVLAQTTPSSKPSPNDIKTNCLAEGKRSGLSGATLEDYVKQCINRNTQRGEKESPTNQQQ